MFSERSQKWKSTYFVIPLPLSIKIGKNEFVLWQVRLVVPWWEGEKVSDWRRAWGALGYWQCSVLGLGVGMVRLKIQWAIRWWYVHFVVCKLYLNKKIKTTNLKNKKLVSIKPLQMWKMRLGKVKWCMSCHMIVEKQNWKWPRCGGCKFCALSPTPQSNCWLFP